MEANGALSSSRIQKYGAIRTAPGRLAAEYKRVAAEYEKARKER
jgi:hypothetical protein